MKRATLMILTILMVAVLCVGLFACADNKANDHDDTDVNIPVEGENVEGQTGDNTPDPDAGTSDGVAGKTDGDAADSGYTVTFVVDEQVTVTIYPTQELTDGEQTLTAISRDGDSGQATLTDGQVNYVLAFAEGYELDEIAIDGSYKNSKVLGNDVYRITKIASDLTVTITAKEAEEEPVEAEVGLTTYSVDTVLDGETVTLEVTATGGTFDATYAKGVLTLDVTAAADTEMEVVLSGSFAGGIVLTDSEASDTSNDLTLSLAGATIVAGSACPLYIDTDADVDISANKGTDNVITDARQAVGEDEVSAAVYVTSDLTLKGKGNLTVTSVNNNGIHGKDDVTVKNLTLYVSCVDNALKGNDSVTVESGTLTLIARQGDGIKTKNSSVSDKGKQKGTITIEGGTIDIYAACDGLDAAYDVVISGGTLNVYTDRYSEYSEEVNAVTEDVYYIRSTTTAYKYSIYYYDAQGNGTWVNSAGYETVQVQSGRGSTTYYYYPMTKPSGYTGLCLYVYSADQTQGQSETYTATTGNAALNSNYDSIAVTVSGSSLRASWVNKSTQSFGPGGMQEGNKEKGDYSTKGIKADNEITISGGTINVQAYDDAIHANSDNALDNNETPLGNITISGGTLTLASNDDGIHADGTLTISGGTISITKSYEGLEGDVVLIKGGNISVIASDDGINACATSGVGLQMDDGYLYVYAGGDGLDANSQTNYQGIVFNGGKVVVISTSGGNSCIDTERGYTYNGGLVIAVCPRGMEREAYNCTSTNKKYTTTSLSGYLVVSGVGVVKVPSISNGFAICLGSSSAAFSTTNDVSSYTLDSNNVCWLQ